MFFQTDDRPLLQSIIDRSADAIFVKDLEGRYVLLNDACARAMGRPASEIVGRTDADIFPARTAAPLRSVDRRVMETGRGANVEETVGEDGAARVYASTKFPWLDGAGNVLGVIGVARDVTGDKRALEDARRRAAQAEAQLEDVNAELESFAYSVSHDLRAPLRSILGFGNILEEDHGAGLDEGGRDALRRMRAAAQRMGHLMDDLVKLSRLTRGELDRQTVDVSALARAVVDELQRKDPDRRVDVVVAPDLKASADPRLLRAALQHLLENAWKFTSKTPAVRIEFGARKEKGETVFFVRDNGAGFDTTYAAKLFGVFQRMHAPEEFPGTGVGLAVVQRIVRRHGGSVWAEGAPGQGATFFFTLPCP